MSLWQAHRVTHNYTLCRTLTLSADRHLVAYYPELNWLRSWPLPTCRFGGIWLHAEFPPTVDMQPLCSFLYLLLFLYSDSEKSTVNGSGPTKAQNHGMNQGCVFPGFEWMCLYNGQRNTLQDYHQSCGVNCTSPRRNAFCASWVMASASSKITSLNPDLQTHIYM